MLLLAPRALNHLKATAVDGSVRMCTVMTQTIMYEYVGKKKNNLFFTLWYRGAILLAKM
jgi:hypothetical protein